MRTMATGGGSGLAAAGRLAGAQSNDSAAWLPAGAESTRILDVLPRFQPDDTVQAVVVYERASGLTPADRAAADADAAAFRRLPGVPGPVAGPEVAGNRTYTEGSTTVS